MNYYMDKEIIIREIEKKDVITMYAWKLDKEIYRFDPMPLPSDTVSLLSDCKAYCERFESDIISKDFDKRKYKYFMITDRAGALIGYINMFSFNHDEKSCEMGIIIGDKRYWNKGIGYKSMKTVIDHAFGNMGMQRLYVETGEKNIPALKLCNKLNFTKCGEYSEDEFKFIVMEITKS